MDTYIHDRRKRDRSVSSVPCNGRKEGWRALIPFYSSWTVVEIAGLKWYWFILYNLPIFVGFLTKSGKVTPIIALLSRLAIVGICYNLSKKFRKGDGWFVLSIFFEKITIPLLGFINKDKYYKSEKVNEHSFLQGLFNK